MVGDTGTLIQIQNLHIYVGPEHGDAQLVSRADIAVTLAGNVFKSRFVPPPPPPPPPPTFKPGDRVWHLDTRKVVIPRPFNAITVSDGCWVMDMDGVWQAALNCNLRHR